MMMDLHNTTSREIKTEKLEERDKMETLVEDGRTDGWMDGPSTTQEIKTTLSRGAAQTLLINPTDERYTDVTSRWPRGRLMLSTNFHQH